ncbi:MAG: hypothetical protein PVI86_10920, partial [Phycisphaerae bacterium]
MDVSRFTRQMAVIPRYRDLFRRTPSERDLLRTVRRYPVGEWLSFLSRFQTMLGPDRSADPQYMGAVLHGAMSQDIRDRLLAFEKKARRGVTLRLFYERQLATLQQYAILHAPETGNGTFNTERGRHDLGRALLITWDLMGAGRREKGALSTLLATVIHDQMRMCLFSGGQYAARAWYFYELMKKNRSKEVRQYLNLFRQATGVNARDAIMGGLCEVIREDTRDPKDIAQGWLAVPAPAVCQNPLEARVLRASAKVRQHGVAEIRTFIRQLEGSRRIRDWNLIALSKSPIADLGQQRAFVLNQTALGRSLFDGVRHAILTAALDKRLPPPFTNAKAVGGLYGVLFERYVTGVLRHVFPNQVIKVKRETKDKRCDLVVWFPDKVMLVEVKGEHFTAKDHASYMSLDKRHDELRNIGIPKAVAQLTATVQALRRGVLTPRGLPDYDWTITPIVPVIVTDERTPQAPGTWDHLYESFDLPFEKLRAAGPIGRLRLLAVDEIEIFPDVAYTTDLATLLLQWGASSQHRDLTWAAHLEDSGIKTSGRFIPMRFFEAMQSLAVRLGLDPAKLTAPDDGKAEAPTSRIVRTRPVAGNRPRKARLRGKT